MKQPDFIIIPTQLLSDNSLQPADRVLFGYIYWIEKLALMKCVASNNTFMELTGFSEKSISIGLRRLEEQGYVSIIYKDNSRRHRVEVQTLIAFNTVNNRPTKRSIQTHQTVSLDPPNGKHNKIDINKKDLITTNVVRPTAYGSSELNEMFNYWQHTTGLAITARTTPNRRAAHNLFKKYGAQRLRRLIDGVAIAQADKYAPRIADFTQLQSKVDELILWGKKKSTNQKRTIKV